MRFYVKTEFAVEASDAEAAEMLVARRIQGLMGITPVVCVHCYQETKRAGGNPRAKLVIEAVRGTEEAILMDSEPMLDEELGEQDALNG